MKSISRAVVGYGVSILAALCLCGCGKPTINGAALPEFYGLYAIDQGKLVQLKQGETPDFSSGVQFLLFDKSVTFGADAKFYSIGFDAEPRPSDDSSFSWQKFTQQIEAYQRTSQAALTGIPETAAPLETLKKPVEKKPEMMLFVPGSPLKPGLYQLGNVVKFWVERQKYQTTIEANAKQALQAERWLDASKLASVALIVGPSSPTLNSDLTQIKFGALSKGARKAVEQENFKLAETLAKRGNDLLPPSQFALEFRSLLEEEIPYHHSMTLARNATRDEAWDVVMQAGAMALRVKPNDAKAKEILSSCPKVLLPIKHDFEGRVNQVATYNLFFASGGNRLSAVVQGIADTGYRYQAQLHAWDLERKSEVAVRQYAPTSFAQSPKDDTIAWAPESETQWFQLYLEKFFTRAEPKQIFGTYPLELRFSKFGFSEDGTIVWTALNNVSENNARKLGLMAAANELGLVETELFQHGLKPCIVFWSVETLRPITLIGFRNASFLNVKNVVLNNKVAVVFEEFSGGWGVDGRPSRLSAWDIASHKPLHVAAITNRNFSVWGISPSGNRAIVWSEGQFRHWNWESKSFESPVKLPTEGNHITVFSPNRKFIADRSTSDPHIYICEFETGKVLCKFKEGPKERVTNMEFSPDGTYLAVALDRQRDFLALWKFPDDVKKLVAR